MDLSILRIDQQEVARKNQKLLEKTGFVIHQQHGQKIYCDPSYTGPQPPQGTEVYCYRIPRDCFEYELVPVFATCGKIFELRLMIEFSGANRSYCYVRYWDPEHAKMAIRKLHNYHIRPGYPLAVTQSVDNRKLCVKTIPPLQSGVTEEEIVKELSTQVSGVIRVKFIARRWLQLEFESHRHAALARRLLVPGNIAIFGRVEIKQVDWADPEVEAKPGKSPESNTMPEHPRVGDEKVVVVSNVAANLGEAETRYWFNILTSGHVVNVIKGDSGVFFITLDSVEAALYAIEKGNQMEFGPTRINVASISSQYPTGQMEGKPFAAASGSFLSQVPPSLYVGPLEQLYNIATKQGWGNPQFSFEQSLSPLGQVIYRYSVSLPKVSTIAVPGEWDSDRSAALINCAVSTLREITHASLQNKYSTPPPPAPASYYRTPPPGPSQSMATMQSRRSFTMMEDKTTAVRLTKEETNLLADEEPYDLTKLSSSLDQMSMKPILAVPPSKKLHKDESHYEKFEL